MAAAAAGGGFFSPLSGGVLAPLQQRRLATPDLSPHARRRQLDPEQQVDFGGFRDELHLRLALGTHPLVLSCCCWTGCQLGHGAC